MSIRARGSTRHRVPLGLVLIATALVLTGVPAYLVRPKVPGLFV